MPLVDLRSDTVTRPTPAMREVMASAPLGDDVLGDDPGALEVQRLAAAMTGKAAALWLPTGTMANQVALGAHTRPGEAIVADAEAHILYYEVGAPAALWGLMTWTVEGEAGIPQPGRIARRLTGENLHTPGVSLIALEDTHNRAGGAVVPLDVLREVRAMADRAGIPVHLDGARVMNAVAADPSLGGGTLQEIAATTDSLTICLSKGLGAPCGTVLCGSEDLIARATRLRKRLGGGMRQIGGLCAAGAYALEHQSARLAEDHARARALADGLGLPAPDTNIVLMDTDGPAEELCAELALRDVLALPAGPRRVRFVTHHDVDDAGIARAVEVVQTVLGQAVLGTRRGSPRTAALSSA